MYTQSHCHTYDNLQDIWTTHGAYQINVRPRLRGGILYTQVSIKGEVNTTPILKILVR